MKKARECAKSNIRKEERFKKREKFDSFGKKVDLSSKKLYGQKTKSLKKASSA